MKLVSFIDEGRPLSNTPRLGAIVDESTIADIASSGSFPNTMQSFIESPDALQKLKTCLGTMPTLKRTAVRLCPPVPMPAKNIICVGKNYRAHAKEFQSSGFDSSSGGEVLPEYPAVFTKAATTLIGDGTPIPASSDPTNSVDYEGELVVVIGKQGRAISRASALDHVFGYTLANDVTSRVTQARHKQWFLGKNFDGFCPMGPAIVTSDEVQDPTRLRLQTKVNGDLRQNAMVVDLIFDIPYLIASISQAMTLNPGDLIATGTPDGVGIGFKPPRYLRPGDVVEISVAEIGTLRNPVS